MNTANSNIESTIIASVKKKALDENMVNVMLQVRPAGSIASIVILYWPVSIGTPWIVLLNELN
jgi:hypothetical protein